MCVMCGQHDECFSHLFFQCSFVKAIWHHWWNLWSLPCCHVSTLDDFWKRRGSSPSKTSFLKIAWSIGPSLIFWQVWLERNRRIFLDKKLILEQVWRRVLGALQETLSAKCDLSVPIDLGDLGVVNSLGLGAGDRSNLSSMHHRSGRERVACDGFWCLPTLGELKINTDGSSRGNPGHVGVGGVGRDSLGVVVFFFSMYRGLQTNNLMEASVILMAKERAVGLGWWQIVCESDS